jgi:hypothetical protein
MAALNRFRARRALVVAALASRVAWAQAPNAPAGTSPPARNVGQAETLFRDAVQRMDRGDYTGACPLLEQSQALDPSSGTLLNLGDCYEHTGRLALAWRTFAGAETLALAGARRDRAEVARARKNAILSRVPHFKLILPERPVVPLSVELDGHPLGAAALEAPVAVDPGDHELRARAPGFDDIVLRVRAGEPGSTTAVKIPEFSRRAAASSTPAPDPGASRFSLDAQDVAAISAGAVGVAGVVVGTVFGLKSQSKHADSDRYCTGRTCQDPRGVVLMDEARTAGNLSTTGFVIGGLSLAAGAVLWFARPFGPRANAAVALAPGSIEVRGAW